MLAVAGGVVLGVLLLALMAQRWFWNVVLVGFCVFVAYVAVWNAQHPEPASAEIHYATGLR